MQSVLNFWNILNSLIQNGGTHFQTGTGILKCRKIEMKNGINCESFELLKNMDDTRIICFFPRFIAHKSNNSDHSINGILTQDTVCPHPLGPLQM